MAHIPRVRAGDRGSNCQGVPPALVGGALPVHKHRMRTRLAHLLARSSAVFLAVGVLVACEGATEVPGSSLPPPLPGEAPERTISALVFSKTAGFRHASIQDATRFFSALDPREGFRLTLSEDANLFTDEGLANHDLVVFANTTGDVLDDAQQAALERFVQRGGGFVGVHAAADTEHGWPFYRALVGATFVNHPEIPVEVLVTVENSAHPATAHLERQFRFTDEWYNFDRNPRETSTVLLTIDEAGFTVPNTPPGPSMGADHPVAWARESDRGRAFYTNLGHRPETWQDPRFQRHLLDGMRWTVDGTSFARATLTSALKSPMALAVTPANEVYVIERTGEVWFYSPVSGWVVQALRLEVDTAQENGLLGIALDPRFTENRHVYLYFSAPLVEPVPASGPPGENVLARFTADADGMLDVATGRELLRVPSERRCCHEGGSLAFGADETLFLSTGDNTSPFESNGAAPLDGRPGRERYDSRRTAGSPFDLRGKILRLNRDGSVPDGNLFPKDGTLGRPEIYAMGVRNPFRIAADPADHRLFFGDIGPDSVSDTARGPRGYDEINLALAPGDYGWPYCIGANLGYANFDYVAGVARERFRCTSTVAPVFAYDYATPEPAAVGTALDDDGEFVGRAAIAGTVYRSQPDADSAFPPWFAGTLLMAEWTRDRLIAVDVDPTGRLRRAERFLASEPFRRPIDLEVGPDGALYVLEFGSGFWGENQDARLTRVEYGVPGRLSPVARLAVSTNFGPAPLEVQVSGAESSAAPGEQIVAYEWTIDAAPEVTEEAEPTYTFDETGAYRVALVVVSSSGRRSHAVSETVIVGNAPPRVRITSPIPNTRVFPGRPLDLSGEASDPEDGPARCEDLEWTVSLGHNTHAHPLATLSGCEATFVPERSTHSNEPGLEFYAIELVYTDRGGPRGEPPLTAREGLKLEFQR